MTRMICLALGAAISLALPVCSKERANTEMVIVHIDREGREYSRRTKLYRSPIECAIKRTEIMILYWQAVDSGYRSGMKATCFDRV